MECDFGFIVNRVLGDIGSLTQLKTGLHIDHCISNRMVDLC